MQNSHKCALSTMAVLALGLIFPSDSLARDHGYYAYCIAINEKETTGWVSSIFFIDDPDGYSGYSRKAKTYAAEEDWLKHLKDKYKVTTKLRINECRTYHVMERKLLNKAYRYESRSSSNLKMIRTGWVFKNRESRRGNRR